MCCNVSSLPFLEEFANVEITPALPKRVLLQSFLFFSMVSAKSDCCR